LECITWKGGGAAFPLLKLEIDLRDFDLTVGGLSRQSDLL